MGHCSPHFGNEMRFMWGESSVNWRRRRKMEQVGKVHFVAVANVFHRSQTQICRDLLYSSPLFTFVNNRKLSLFQILPVVFSWLSWLLLLLHFSFSCIIRCQLVILFLFIFSNYVISCTSLFISSLHHFIHFQCSLHFFFRIYSTICYYQYRILKMLWTIE